MDIIKENVTDDFGANVETHKSPGDIAEMGSINVIETDDIHQAVLKNFNRHLGVVLNKLPHFDRKEVERAWIDILINIHD